MVDSELVVFAVVASGLEGSDLTSELLVLLVDSVVVLGPGACTGAGAAAGAAEVAAGVCSQPVSIRPTAIRASDANSL